MFSANPDVMGMKSVAHHRSFTNTISLHSENNHKPQSVTLFLIQQPARAHTAPKRQSHKGLSA